VQEARSTAVVEVVVRGALGGGRSDGELTTLVDEAVARVVGTSLLEPHRGGARNASVDPNSGDTTFYVYL
jgi:hypothetical protein